MSQLTLLFILAFISSIPILSSSKSFSNIGLLSSFILLTFVFNIELINPDVISSFPTCPNILLNT